MITWKLWYALNHPPATHPIFWRTLRRFNTTPLEFTSYSGHLSRVDKLSLAYLVVFALLVFVTNSIPQGAQIPLLTLLLFLLTIPIIVPILIVLSRTAFSGSFHGLLWTLSISQLIARERENHTYELLRLFPAGVLAPLWAMCTGCVYSKQHFNQILDLHNNTLRLIAGVGFVLVVALLIWVEEDTVTTIVQVIFYALLLLALLHLDFIQSLLTSLLLSMIIPLYSPTLLDARLWAAGSFLLIQITTYTISLLAVTFLLPGLFAGLALGGWLALCMQFTFALAIFYSIRELVLVLLWRWLRQLVSDPLPDLPADSLPTQ